MSKPSPKLDYYFKRQTKWQESVKELRSIILKTELEEQPKWGCPCYSLNGNNVVLIHYFKNYCALLFMKGVLLKDPKNLLIQQTKNVQARRQLRFTSKEEIVKLKTVIKAYVEDAIKVEKSGKQIELKTTTEYEVPEELSKKFYEDPNFKEAFYKLTPGRQHGYLLLFAAAKLSKTRLARIEKYADQILDGIGLTDEYSNRGSKIQR